MKRKALTIPVIQVPLWLIAVVWCMFTGCSSSHTPADIIFTNGKFYTVNEMQPRAEAIAVTGGIIVAVGSRQEIEALADADTRMIDLKGAFAMPGFIEGHGHFDGIGENYLNVDLTGTQNWPEVVQRARIQATKIPTKDWVVGRGWHQEKWDALPKGSVDGYPDHYLLSSVTPYHPVMLEHASGHSLIANARAMQLAGVTRETPDPAGGRIVRNAFNEPIGVFEENAMALILDVYIDYLASLQPSETAARWKTMIEHAQRECLEKGITSFQDAGTTFEALEQYTRAVEEQTMDIRLYCMLREPLESVRQQVDRLPILGLGNDRLTCRSVKVMFDGALGSYGAWLLEPYADKPGYFGQNTTTLEELSAYANLAIEHKLQLCTHAIGDRANREVLNVYEQTFKEHPDSEDLRWRIEHAQHIHPDDIPRFRQLDVIASMQAIHCTSDAPFVVSRLGEERARSGAYAWRSLLDSGAVIANGTDAPVEDVNPLYSIYASVTRKPAGGGSPFFPEQSMSRAEAIRSYTLANAYAAFEEDKKGSLEKGKYADLVVLSNDITQCAEEEILQTRVLYTVIGGEIVFSNPAND